MVALTAVEIHLFPGEAEIFAKPLTDHCYKWPCFGFNMFQVMTTSATLPICHPVLHQSWARKRMAPRAHTHLRDAHTHLRDADWYLTISWQFSLLAKQNEPEFTRTKSAPRFEKVKTSQQILSRDGQWRKNLHVWGCSSKKVCSYTAAVNAAL